MDSFGQQTMVLDVIHACGNYDPVSSRIGRDGLDRQTIERLHMFIEHPAIEIWFRALARPDLTEDRIVELLAILSSGPGILDQYPPPDLPSYLGWVEAHRSPHGDVAAAFAGLLALALLEGFARRARPQASHPYFALRTIEKVAMPVADLLVATDLLGGAAMLCSHLRGYMLTATAQRQSEHGQQLVADCRKLERRHALERRTACQEAAWLLRDFATSGEYGRAALATVFYATGESARALHLARGSHLPSVAVLTDLVEVSLELVPRDPLLGSVWGEWIMRDATFDLPERVALPLRSRRRDVNPRFKAVNEALKGVTGHSLGEAYALTLFGFISGLWSSSVPYEPEAWATLEAAMEYPLVWDDDPGAYARIVDLYMLAFEPGTPIPPAQYVFDRTGWPDGVTGDIRALASASLSLDAHTGRSGQLGRSLAYDSPFLTEPARRHEPTQVSLAALEQHRSAAIKYWLRCIPPYLPAAKRSKQRAIVEQDIALTTEYQGYIVALNVLHSEAHHRIYGEEPTWRTLRFDEGTWAETLNRWTDKYLEWADKAEQDFPEYAAQRLRTPWPVEGVQHFLRTGASL